MKELRNLRIARTTREKLGYVKPIFQGVNPEILLNQAQELSSKYQEKYEVKLKEGQLYACGILFKIYQSIISNYLLQEDTTYFSRVSDLYDKNINVANLIEYFDKFFPDPKEVAPIINHEENLRAFFVYEVMERNTAIKNATDKLIFTKEMNTPPSEKAMLALISGMGEKLQENFSKLPDNGDLFSFLIKPAEVYPDSLEQQIDYIEQHWIALLDRDLLVSLKRTIGILKEENKPRFFGGGPGEQKVPDYSKIHNSEIEAFSSDRDWMPNVIMIAKSTYVWLDQLSKKYKKDIKNLNQIPDKELDELQNRGFTALWLIGLWQRSNASKKIKNLCGNPEAESSAYSLKNYIISDRIGGEPALNDLDRRCKQRGIKLACDMVPNHTGIDSDWMKYHDDYFISQSSSPYPNYTFNGPDLSDNPEVEIKIEDHYYDKTDAAVTFKKTNKRTGETRYFFHGNDGTTMPWNDTAQLDFLNPNTREAVIQQIIAVAKKFHVIRFDAAMTLSKKHIQRLWYPKPGTGGDIPGRAIHGLSDNEFNKKIPNEFWREVVDRIAIEVPDTLLLAEAFWMMESFFVRTLGMHRVYNSAFMNMLKDEENKKYRDTIKATIKFDPEILQRYVNFMNNPDEDTAISQFGDGDRYFGVCTLLATLPGLPMFGHGQIEGYKEKYGMEYAKAYWNEQPNEELIKEHYSKIFPLLKIRYLFSSADEFNLFDVINNSRIQENIFAYSNGKDGHMTLVFYNNKYERAEGRIFQSAPKLVRKADGSRQEVISTLFDSLHLTTSDDSYVLYYSFTDKLTYIRPLNDMQKNGLFIALNGYETKVLLHIRQVKDIEGYYKQLYERFGALGFKDLEEELKYLKLGPVYAKLQTIKEPRFQKALKALLSNKLKKTDLKQFKDDLLALYQKEELVIPEFSSPTKIQVEEMVNKIRLASGKTVFKSGNSIIEHFEKIISIYFLIKPMITSGSCFKEFLGFVDNYKLDEFMEIKPFYSHLSALLAVSENYSLESLFEQKDFQILIGVNTYEGKTYYISESFEYALYVYSFGKALSSKRINTAKIEADIKAWLDKDCNSDYFLDNLIRKE